MTLVRRAGIPVNREKMLGTLFGGRPDAKHEALGFGVHLGISGAFGLLYESAFARRGMARGWKSGLRLSPFHFLVSGLFFWVLDRAHPLVPHVFPPPGPFWSNHGARGVALLLLLKGAFGASFGELDRRLAGARR